VLTHKGSWGKGTITRHGFPDDSPFPAVCLETPATLIEGGTSGGPVIDDAGRLIGVVSNSGGAEKDTEHNGVLSIAHLALPRWILDQVLAAQNRVELIEPVEDLKPIVATEAVSIHTSNARAILRETLSAKKTRKRRTE
jgi:hypothetical protein